ncbi:hypothetical protein [Couchioplanes caeruleus]|uniref:Uncharacterized protein n=2 Tax=Couchioplanes caeruleus TaxID=56438 RepID=A0A1K0FAV7_9ACTN|nr:hypothetical protein [Couchioplanes caeruleus]OJF09977.1 hypothetical protein BG844_34365 [Couchioplanes caeruleus subsp. caeruleus]ROP31691.1 hypothetical protein EDD30_4613 [Couchioplanes caeruleus]
MLGSGLGEALVATGLDGGWKIEVGVGTGGSVSVGTGDPDDDGTAELAATPGGALGATDCTTDTGSGARGTHVVPDPDAGVVAFTGAVPKPPAPPGAFADGGAASGVPRVQPTATENGRPSATMPKKTDLGDSRTP